MHPLQFLLKRLSNLTLILLSFHWHSGTCSTGHIALVLLGLHKSPPHTHFTLNRFSETLIYSTGFLFALPFLLFPPALVTMGEWVHLLGGYNCTPCPNFLQLGGSSKLLGSLPQKNSLPNFPQDIMQLKNAGFPLKIPNPNAIPVLEFGKYCAYQCFSGSVYLNLKNTNYFFLYTLVWTEFQFISPHPSNCFLQALLVSPIVMLLVNMPNF